MPLTLADVESVGAYLRDREMDGEVTSVDALVGGVSSDIFLVRRSVPPDWVVKQALPNLRVAVDWPSDPLRIHREAAALRWLETVLSPGSVAAAVFEDHEAHVLIMEAVPEPCPTWKALLLDGDLRTVHVTEFATMLGEIHRAGAAAFDSLRDPFEDQSVFVSLRLEPYYEYTATQVPAMAAFLTELVERTLTVRLTLVHADYSPKNVLVHDDRFVLLDHEVAHLGDPAFDIGFAMAHFLGKAHYLPEHRSAFQSAAHDFWAGYRHSPGTTRWDGDFDARAAAHTVGCTLARARGRSPLEYLDDKQRSDQQAAIEAVAGSVPVDVDEVIDDFVAALP